VRGKGLYLALGVCFLLVLSGIVAVAFHFGSYRDPLAPDAPPAPQAVAPAPLPAAVLADTDIPGAWDCIHELRARGLTVSSGGESDDGSVYIIQVAGRVLVFVWPDDHRIHRAAWFVWTCEDPDDLVRAAVVWREFQAVMSSTLAGDDQSAYVEWVTAQTWEALTLLSRAPTVVEERRFGDCVVRLENARSEFTGWTTVCEIARAYKPWHEIAAQPAPASWRDMRKGLTLEEVESFAGPGRCKSVIGETVQYDFGDGMATGWVNFANGRADAWYTPWQPY